MEIDPLLRMSEILKHRYDENKISIDPDQGVLGNTISAILSHSDNLRRAWKSARTCGWPNNEETQRVFFDNMVRFQGPYYYMRSFETCSEWAKEDGKNAYEETVRIRENNAADAIIDLSAERLARFILSVGLEVYSNKVRAKTGIAKETHLFFAEGTSVPYLDSEERKIFFSGGPLIPNPPYQTNIATIMRDEAKNLLASRYLGCGDYAHYYTDAEYCQAALSNRVLVSIPEHLWPFKIANDLITNTDGEERVRFFLDQAGRFERKWLEEFGVKHDWFDSSTYGVEKKLVVPPEETVLKIMSDLGFLEPGESIQSRVERMGSQRTEKGYRYNPQTLEYVSEEHADGRFRLRLASSDPVLKGIWAFAYVGGLPDYVWGPYSKLPFAPLEVVFRYANSASGIKAMLKSVNEKPEYDL